MAPFRCKGCILKFYVEMFINICPGVSVSCLLYSVIFPQMCPHLYVKYNKIEIVGKVLAYKNCYWISQKLFCTTLQMLAL